MFALRLKELRESKGLSQKALANKLGVSQSTVGMWESQKREPNFSTTEEIANFFGVTIDYLLDNSHATKEVILENNSDNSVVIFNRNGEIIRKKFSEEQMKYLEKFISSLTDEDYPDL